MPTIDRTITAATEPQARFDINPPKYCLLSVHDYKSSSAVYRAIPNADTGRALNENKGGALLYRLCLISK
jgi:hypothetical protein